MHDHLKEEIELMGYKAENVMEDTHAEQDFLIMSRLMKITRTADFSEEELELYRTAAASAVEDVRYVMGSRILTPDFSQEELNDYQWSAEHPGGSCRGFRLTDDPTEEEIKEWQKDLEYLNALDFDEARTRVKFLDKDEEHPYAKDLHWINFPGNGPKNAYEAWRATFPDPDDTHQVVAQCELGRDPYSILDPW